MKAIKTSYDNGDQYSLIMEDDLSIDSLPLINTSLIKLIEDAPEDLDALMVFNAHFIELDKTENVIYKKYNEYIFSTAAYIIKRSGMKKLLDIFYIDNVFVFDKTKLPPMITSDRVVFMNVNTYYLPKSLFYLNSNIAVDSNIGYSIWKDSFNTFCIWNNIKIINKLVNKC